MAPLPEEKLPQPFLHPDRVYRPPESEGHSQDVALLRSWTNSQPHLPPLSDDHLLLFLHSCNFVLNRTQKTIDNYFTTRSNEPYLFNKKDPSSGDLAYVFSIAQLVPCPKRTKEGYAVLLYRLTDFDPSHVDFLQGMKAFFAFNDVRISEDGVMPGYVVVFDMRGIVLSHLAIVSLSGIRKFMHYIQECHPCRLKGIHVINTVKFFDKVLALIKPFIKSEMLQMLHLHGEDLTEMYKVVPQELLPSDYGGQATSCKELHETHIKLMVDDYALWLKQEEALRVDETKRREKCKSNQFNSMEGSFRSLAID